MTHNTALLASGRPVPLLGRLLADTRAGVVVPLDPDTGDELKADERPAFVLSTEGEATDGNIVRMHWNLNRANNAGIPVLWNHKTDVLLGRWEDLRIQDIGGRQALVGRAYFDPEDETAQHRRGQVKRGILSAVSIGWMPGESVRRGELDPGDPLYREPVDGFCGPEEGLVMGTERSPNVLIEASIVPCPAQEDAVVIERLHARAAQRLQTATRGGDLDSLLATLAGDPRVRAWARALVRAEIGTLSPSSPPVRTLADLLRSV